jgi:hypothetical protein
VLINFTNPLMISTGIFPDQIICSIRNASMLKDKNNGLEM